MPEEILLEYIKETTTAGFAEEKIRTALRQAGWNDAEVAEGFAAAKGTARPPASPGLAEITKKEIGRPGWFDRHKGTLLTILIVIILLPVLAYGGFWAYQKFFRKTAPAAAPNGQQTNNQASPFAESSVATTNTDPAQAKTRDNQRLSDVSALQTALTKYYQIKKSYPKTLADLAVEKILAAVPADPKTKEAYLYSALGEPALHYSLSFLLETRVGTLAPGLQVVSSESRLPAELIQNQQNVVQGITAAVATEKLLVTDLRQTPFYIGEEIRLEIAPPSGIIFTSVFLIMDNLELVDETTPFSFSFTAPKLPGEYTIKIFAFAKNGQSYMQKASLTIQK